MSEAHQSTLDWRILTSLPEKQALYAEDSFFREGLSDVLDAWGDAAAHCVQRTALLLFKPDAIGGRRVEPATRLLAERGFCPVAVECFAFSAAIYHGLYRYQLRRGTLDKVRLYTRWAAGLPCLAVAYHDELPQTGLPASVRLKTIKGHALVDRRQEGDLRTLLQSANSIANFIHAADEPADVVREVSICIAAERRPAFLQAIRLVDTRAGTQALHQLIKQAEQQIPQHDANPVAAGERIRCKLVENGRRDTHAALAMMDGVLQGETLNLRAFEHALGNVARGLDPLDIFVFASQYIARDLPGERGELDEDCVTGWLQTEPATAT